MCGGDHPLFRGVPVRPVEPPGDRPKGQPIENPTVLLSFSNPSPGLKSDTFSRPAASSADPEKESAHICRERKEYGEVSFPDVGIDLVLLNIEVERPQNSRVESEPIRSPFHPT